MKALVSVNTETGKRFIVRMNSYLQFYATGSINSVRHAILCKIAGFIDRLERRTALNRPANNIKQILDST